MSESHVHLKGQFFGCYLLCSLNPKHKGRTYIGFTVNPNRRINQHNSGYQKGGARRTSGKGPWEMVLIVHGFPNEISALRFEWAWQNPQKSLRLKHLVPKTPQYTFAAKFNVLSEMLRIGPWHRLPLTIRWLKQEYKKDFPINKQPPNHMPIEYGPIELLNSSISTARAKYKNNDITRDLIMLFKPTDHCFICNLGILDTDQDVFSKNCLGLKCTSCNTNIHTICLCKHFLEQEKDQQNDKEIFNILPVEGNCPKCQVYLLWGDLIKYRQNSFKTKIENSDLDNINNNDDDDDEDFSEKEDQDDNDGSRYGEF